MKHIKRKNFLLSAVLACWACTQILAEPKIEWVHSTNADTLLPMSYYGLGTSIYINVGFDGAVDVTGTPVLELATAGSSNGLAVYFGGTGTSTLKFEYVISPGHVSTQLNYVATNSLTLSGGATIKAFGGGVDADLTLPDLNALTALAGSNTIHVATPPIIMRVSSDSANSVYGTGAVVNVYAVFSEPVQSTLMSPANPHCIELETAGSSNAFAYYVSGSGTNRFDFEYKIGPGQQTAPDNLGYVDILSFVTNSGSIIANRFGLPANCTLPADGSGNSLRDLKNIIIDTPAVVTNVVATTPDGTYGVGSVINISVQFSESVTNADVATLRLDLGPSSNVFAYRTGSGTGSSIEFKYFVGHGQSSTQLCYVDAASLQGSFVKASPGGSVDGVLLGLPTPGKHGSLCANSQIEIATAGPVVSAYTPQPGAFNVNSNVVLVLDFDKEIFKGGAGSIGIYRFTGNVLHEAVSVNTTNVVVTNTRAYVYFETPLESLTNYYVNIDDSVFRDVLTNFYEGISSPYTWRFTAADFSGPHVAYVTSTNNNAHYGPGANINIRVYFSEPLKQFGIQRMLLNTGQSAVFQNHVPGSEYLDLRYTVQPGDNTPRLQYAGTVAFTNDVGSYVRDLSDNDADLTLPLLTSPNSLGGSKEIIIDTTAPWVINVTSTNDNGLYTTNTTINVLVQFNERVWVSNFPAMRLDTGGINRDAVYVGGSGTTNLAFEYVVESGDWTTNLNYLTTNSFSNSFGGVITDAAGNNARMGLPPLASVHSLGRNKSIAIDTIPPTVVNVTSTNFDGYYRAGAAIDVHCEISEPVTVVGGPPQMRLNSGAAASAVYDSLSDATNMVFIYTVAAGENSPRLDYASAAAFRIMGAQIRDAAGNFMLTNLPAPGYPGSLGANKELVIDTIAPTVTVASDSTTPTNGSPIVFIATFSETVSNFNTSAIGIDNGTLVPSNFTGQIGEVFRFHVVPAGFGSELVQVVTVNLNAGAAEDMAGNPSLAALPADRIYDTVRPVGVMSSISDNPTEFSPIPVSILFSETMRDFDVSCLRATNAAIVNFSGSGVTYSFELIPFEPGIVRANIDEGVAHDMAGNRCFPSAAFVRTYVFPSSDWLDASDGEYTDRVALRWGATPGATTYRVLRNKEDDRFFAEYIGLATDGPSFNDTTAVPGTLYHYWVRPVNVYGGIGEFSASDVGWRALAPPSGLSATDGAYNDRIVVTWNVLPNADGYELFRSTTPSFAGAALLARLTGTSYSDMQVGAGFYYYWVRATTSLGTSPFAGPESGWRIAFGDALNNTLLDWRSGGSNEWFIQSEVTHGDDSAAQSGFIRDSEQTWIEAVAYGPGTLGFWWKVSSETNWDFLRFSVNGIVLAETSGDTEWQQLFFNVPAGTNLLRWNYIKDHSRSHGADAGWLDEVAYAEIPRHVVASDGVFHDRVRVTWYGSFVPGTSYRIYRSVSANPVLAMAIADTTFAWYDDTSVVPGRIYHYWVQSLTAHGNSSLGEYDQGHSRQVDYDYNADGRADLAVYDRTKDTWHIASLTGSVLAYGMPSGDSDHSRVTLVPADYDGDGAMDIGVYHEATGTWYVKSVSSGQAVVWAFVWGAPGCAAVPADYDGDGRTDVAVFVRATGEWYVWPWTGQWGIASWGWNGAEPIPADYDGDGKADLAVFDRLNGRWYVCAYHGNVLVWDLHWGWSSAVVLPADYDGDGRADFGVYDPATGCWYILDADQKLMVWALPWGSSQMVPVPADYDGDGRADFAVYAPLTGNWYIWTWSGLSYTDLRWGYHPMEPVIRGQ